MRNTVPFTGLPNLSEYGPAGVATAMEWDHKAWDGSDIAPTSTTMILSVKKTIGREQTNLKWLLTNRVR